MTVTFGKHVGKSVELLVLKHPEYVRWLKSTSGLSGAALALRNECLRLISRFDSAAVKEACLKCRNAATRVTFYAGNVSDCYPWCDTCDPYSAGAIQGKLAVVKTYADALNQADLYHSGKIVAQRNAIRTLGRAKGLGKTVTANQAHSFFAQ